MGSITGRRLAAAALFLCVVAPVLAAAEESAAPAAPPSSTAGNSASGTVTGTLFDSLSGKGLPGAAIEVVGKGGKKTTADPQGRYQLTLPPGTYRLRAQAPQHTARESSVEVRAGETSRLSLALQTESTVLEIVEVFSELARHTESAVVEERRQSAVATENVSAETIQKSSDSDAGEIVQRLSGVTIKDDKFFVRGLGERYSSALLNMSRLPSTNPDKRVIALDLFPASFIESLSITKSYTPDLPGDFSGGLVDIRLRDAPEKLTYSLGIGTGLNTETTFQSFETYKGSSLDYFGFGAGYRSRPGILPYDILDPTTPETGSRARKLASSFKNIWSIDRTTAPPNLGLSASVGNNFGKWGFNLGGIYGNTWQVFRDDYRRAFYNDSYFKTGDFQGSALTYDRSRFDTQLGGLLTAVYHLRDEDQVTLRTFVNRSTSDEVLDGSGVNDNREGFEVYQTRLQYREEQLAFGQLAGNHDFSLVRVDWRTALSQTTRDDPDTRYVRRLRPDDQPTATPYLDFAPPSLLRTFVNLDEVMTDNGLDFTIPFKTALPFTDVWDGFDAKLKTGLAYTYRDRHMRFRRYRFGQGQQYNQSLGVLPVEQILVPENIGTVADGAIFFEESTQPKDRFQASQEIAATYGMLELPLVPERLRFVGGVRLEYSYIDTNSYETANKKLRSIINDTDPIPGVNLIYTPREDMNVRAGFSRTVSRPEFRELTPTEFPVPDGERSVQGNPLLVSAHIDSYDLRWEWFFNDLELFSVSAFYKDITDAVEQVTLSRTSSTVDSFRNASGWLWGFEFELRKNLDSLTPLLPKKPWAQKLGYELSRFSIYSNASIIDSEASLNKPPADIICDPSDPDAPPGCGETQTSSKRQLVGQSPYSVNVALEYSTEDWGLYRLLYNTVDRKIVAAGVDGLPDIYEERRDQLDFIWTDTIEPFGVPLEAKVGIENLLNDPYEQTQGGASVVRFKTGVRFSFGVSYKF